MSSEKRETKETERAGERDSERIWNMFTLILLASDVIVALHLVDPSVCLITREIPLYSLT